MARTASKHSASSMRAWILTIVGRPRSGGGVATIRLSSRAYPRYEAAGTTTPESRMSQVGLHFDYLSPINEPQWAWDGAGQEGTPASNVEMYALVRLLSKELSRRKLSTRIVIGEAGKIDYVFQKVDDDGRDDQARFFF